MEVQLLYTKYEEQVKKFDQEPSLILLKLILENLEVQDGIRKKLASLVNVEWEKGNRTPKPTQYPKVILDSHIYAK